MNDYHRKQNNSLLMDVCFCYGLSSFAVQLNGVLLLLNT
jgi:hypothetical protein